MIAIKYIAILNIDILNSFSLWISVISMPMEGASKFCQNFDAPLFIFKTIRLICQLFLLYLQI